jgi:hypothetical protein
LGLLVSVLAECDEQEAGDESDGEAGNGEDDHPAIDGGEVFEAWECESLEPAGADAESLVMEQVHESGECSAGHRGNSEYERGDVEHAPTTLGGFAEAAG